MSTGVKHHIKEVPVANEKLYEEISKLSKVPKKEVIKIIAFVGEYIAETMKKGDMEGVMIPYFGKFKPNQPKIKALYRKRMNMLSGEDMVIAALHGYPIKDNRIKPETDETI